MIIAIDTASAVPPFDQLREQVATMVRSGVLPSGTRLPTVRQLANDLGLAPGTVARAYRELEAAGLVETRGRRGTVVRPLPAVKLPVAERRRRLDDAALTFAAQAARLGVDPRDAARAVERAFSALPDERSA